MMTRILPILALLAFAAVPLALGSADQGSAKDSAPAKNAAAPATKSAASAANTKTSETSIVKTAEAKNQANHSADECLASETVLRSLEAREQNLKAREEKLRERESELNSQQAALQEELGKLKAYEAETQGAHAKELADREEKVSKLIETFESMSPKAAAGVIAGVDEELAVTALSRLSSEKAGKILAKLNPEQSARLSERMAYGNSIPGKEASHGASERAPASQR